jgi:exonuclease III
MVSNDFILDHNSDIMCLSETWMTGTEADNAVIDAVLPQSYAILHAPRGSRGSGTAIIYRYCVSLRPTTTSTTFTSFEHQDYLAIAA